MSLMEVLFAVRRISVGGESTVMEASREMVWEATVMVTLTVYWLWG